MSLKRLFERGPSRQQRRRGGRDDTRHASRRAADHRLTALEPLESRKLLAIDTWGVGISSGYAYLILVDGEEDVYLQKTSTGVLMVANNSRFEDSGVPGNPDFVPLQTTQAVDIGIDSVGGISGSVTTVYVTSGRSVPQLDIALAGGFTPNFSSSYDIGGQFENASNVIEGSARGTTAIWNPARTIQYGSVSWEIADDHSNGVTVTLNAGFNTTAGPDSVTASFSRASGIIGFSATKGGVAFGISATGIAAEYATYNFTDTGPQTFTAWAGQNIDDRLIVRLVPDESRTTFLSPWNATQGGSDGFYAFATGSTGFAIASEYVDFKNDATTTGSVILGSGLGSAADQSSDNRPAVEMRVANVERPVTGGFYGLNFDGRDMDGNGISPVERGLLNITPSGSMGPAGTLIAEFTDADAVIASSFDVTTQTWLVRSQDTDAQFKLSTRNPSTGQATGLLKGGTVAITFATQGGTVDSPNEIDLRTDVSQLRISASSDSPDGSAYPVRIEIDEASGLTISATPNSTADMSFKSNGDMRITGAIATSGRLQLESGGGLVADADITTVVGDIDIVAPSISGVGAIKAGVGVEKLDVNAATTFSLVGGYPGVTWNGATSTFTGPTPTGAADLTPLIDGVALTAGSRLLVKNEDDASQNGIYVVTAPSAIGAAVNAATTTNLPTTSVDLATTGSTAMNADSATGFTQLVRDPAQSSNFTLAIDGVAISDLGGGRPGVGTRVLVKNDQNGISARAFGIYEVTVAPNVTFMAEGGNVVAATSSALGGVYVGTLAGATLEAAANGTINAVGNFGATLAANDRILVKDQGVASQNGIYVVTTVGDTNTKWKLTRAVDADSTAELSRGLGVFVTGGTLAGEGFALLTDANATGTAALNFTGAADWELTRTADADSGLELATGVSMRILGGDSNGGDRWVSTSGASPTIGTTSFSFALAVPQTANTAYYTLSGFGAGALPAIDGVALAVNERVLVKNQADPADNGVYVVTSAGTGTRPWILTRATDANTGLELQDGTAFQVMGGTQANTFWEVALGAGPSTPDIGVTSIPFAQLATGWTLERADDANTSGELPEGTTTRVLAGDVNAGTRWSLITPAPMVLDSTNLNFVQVQKRDARAATSADLTSSYGLAITNRLADAQAATTADLGAIANATIQTLTGQSLTDSTLTIDGIGLLAGQRALVKNQSVIAENGIYLVVHAGGRSVGIGGVSAAAGSPILTVANTSGLVPGMLVIGSGIPAGTTIAAVGTTTVTLSQNATATTASLTKTGYSAAAGATSLTGFADTTGLVVGMELTGAGIAAGTTITGVDVTSITLSLPTVSAVASVLAGAGLTASTTSGSQTVSMASTTGLVVGMEVTIPGIPPGSVILEVIPNVSITLSAAATATASGQAVTAVARLAAAGRLSAHAAGSAFSFSGSTTGGSATVTSIASTTGLQPGMLVTAANGAIPAGTTIVSVDSATQITLSQNASATTAGGVIAAGGWVLARAADARSGNPVGTTVLTGSAVSGQTAVTGLASTAGLSAGMVVTGVGIPIGTSILRIDNASTITLTRAATATGSPALNFTPAVAQIYVGATQNASTAVTLASTFGLVPGMLVSGAGIPPGTTVAAIPSGTSITLSQAATATAAAVDLSFGQLIVAGISTSTGATTTLTLPTAEIARLRPGMLATGDGIVGGTTILSIDSDTQVTLSRQASSVAPAVARAVTFTLVGSTGLVVTGGFVNANTPWVVEGTVGQPAAPVAIVESIVSTMLENADAATTGVIANVPGATTQTLSSTTIDNSALLIDSVVLVDGQRVLVKDQTNAAENGVYFVTNAGSATVAFTANAGNGASQLTNVANAAFLAVGMLVAGTNVPAGALIVSIAGTTVTLDRAVTGAIAAGALAAYDATTTFTVSGNTSGTTTLAGIPSTAGLEVGMRVTGPDIAADTIITAVGADSVTLSNAATGSTTGGVYLIGGWVLTRSADARLDATLLRSVTAPLTGGAARVATTAPLDVVWAAGTAPNANTLTNAGSPGVVSIDGVVLATGDRVLVKNQADASQNGVYAVTSTGAAITFSGSTTAGFTTVSGLANVVVNGTPGSIASLRAGMAVSGAGIPAGTTIASVSAVTSTLVLSQPATASATATGLEIRSIATTGATALGSSVVTSVASTVGLAAGMLVAGDGIAAGTTITSFTSNSVTLSLPATGTFSAANLVFGGKWVLTRTADALATAVLPAGSGIAVTAGTTQAGTSWLLSGTVNAAAGLQILEPGTWGIAVNAGAINANTPWSINGTVGDSLVIAAAPATLQSTGTRFVLDVDGVATVRTDRILVKDQADATENGLYQVVALSNMQVQRENVRVATRTSLAGVYLNNTPGVSPATLTAGGNGRITVDGVSLVLNDRVLLAGQSNPAQNGVYKVTQVGSSASPWRLTRTPDFDGNNDFVDGWGVAVVEGTFGNQGFVLSGMPPSVSLGSTPITFVDATRWRVTRTPDADTASELAYGTFVRVTSGSENAGTGWSIGTLEAIDLGETPIDFYAASGPYRADGSDLTVTAETGTLVVNSVLEAAGDTVTLVARGSTGAISGSTRIVAAHADLSATRTISVTGSVSTLSGAAGSGLTFGNTGALALTDVSTTAGPVTVTAAGTIRALDVRAGGSLASPGNVSITATAGGIEVGGIQTSLGSVVLASAVGDIAVNGRLAAQGTGHDLTFDLPLGNLSFSAAANVTASDQLKVVAPVGVITAEIGASIVGQRLSWTNGFSPLGALGDYQSLEVNLTRAGDLDLSRASALTIEGATTVDGSITIAAGSLRIAGAVVAGDLDQSNDHDITLLATSTDVLVDAPVTTADQINVSANSGSISATDPAIPGMLQASRLTLNASGNATVRTTVVELVSASLTGTASVLSLTETDDLAIGAITASGESAKAQITAGLAASSGVMTVGSIAAQPGASVSLVSYSNLLAATSNAAAEITSGTTTLESKTGRIDLDTSADSITAAASQGSVTIDDLRPDGTAFADIAAGTTITLSAVGDAAATKIVSKTGNVSLTASKEPGSLSEDIVVGSISAPGSIVTLTAAGSILRASPGAATTDVSTGTLRATASQGIDLSTAIASLAARVSGSGTLTIRDVDGIALGDPSIGSPLSTVTTANGSIAVSTGAGRIAVNQLVEAGGDRSTVTLTSKAGSSPGSGDILVAATIKATDDRVILDASGGRILAEPGGAIASESLTWYSQVTPSLAGSFTRFSPNITAAGNIDPAAFSQPIILEGASTIDGSIHLTAPQIRVIGPVSAVGTDALARNGSVRFTATQNGAGTEGVIIESLVSATHDIAIVSQGRVDAVTLETGGTGYASPTVAISSGNGATATAVVVGGRVVALTPTAQGANYVTEPTVTISGGGGSGAVYRAVLGGTSGQQVTAYQMISEGAGYSSSSLPTVAIVPVGSGATATATATGGVIDPAISVTAGGSGFVDVPNVSFSGGGSNATATASLYGPVSIAADRIASIVVNHPGSGYTGNVPLVIAAPDIPLASGGIQAAAEAVVVNGSVVAVTVTNPGRGYLSTPSVTLAVPAGGGTAATFTAALTNGQLSAAGSVTLEAASDVIVTGGIVAATVTADALENVIVNGLKDGVGMVQLTNAGRGYTSAPVVTFSAPSSGVRATGYAVMTAAGSVERVVVTNRGSGYTSAPTITFSGGGASRAATGVAVLSGGVLTASSEASLTAETNVSVQNKAAISAPTLRWVSDTQPTDSLLTYGRIDADLRAAGPLTLVRSLPLTVDGIKTTDGSIAVTANGLTIAGDVLPGVPANTVSLDAGTGSLQVTADGSVGSAGVTPTTVTIRSALGISLASTASLYATSLDWKATSFAGDARASYSKLTADQTGTGPLTIDRTQAFTGAASLQILDVRSAGSAIDVKANALTLTGPVKASAAGADVSLTAVSGSISGAGLVTANDLVSLRATAGIGSTDGGDPPARNPVMIDAARLEAMTTGGSIVIDNASARLTLGDVKAPVLTGSPPAANGWVDLDTAGALVISGALDYTPGRLRLDATGVEVQVTDAGDAVGNSQTLRGRLAIAEGLVQTLSNPAVVTFAPSIAVVGITQSAPLDVTKTVTIDGGLQRVQIDGSAASKAAGTQNGIVFTATVDGGGSLAAGLRNLSLTGFDGSAVVLAGDRSRLENVWIGLDREGRATAATANGVGIEIQATAAGNRSGGSLEAQRNVVSNNTGVGIKIGGSSNTVENTYVGTSVAGAAALKNVQGGILVTGDAADGNAILNSVISGNGSFGVKIEASADDTRLEGNVIGLNAAGTAVVANNGSGVIVTGTGTTGTAIGGDASLERNVISGNTAHGVLIGGSSSATSVAGNVIGLSSSGLVALRNALDGVRIEGGSSGNLVGGVLGTPSTYAGNRIAGNGASGVAIVSAGTGNEVSANLIGLSANGTTIIANAGAAGVLVSGTASTAIGTKGQGNDIVGSRVGVLVQKEGSTPSTGVTVLANTIRSSAAGGVVVAGSTGSQIGGLGSGEGNSIHSNVGDGVAVTANASNTTILGNAIGAVGKINRGDGIEINNSLSATIQGNTIVASASNGILLATNAKNATIGGSNAGEGNTIEGSTLDGILVGSGSGSATILGNTIKNNRGDGIELNGTPPTGGTGAIGLTIGAGNTIQENTGNGINVVALTGTPTSSAATIRGSTISGNSQSGISLSRSRFVTIGGSGVGDGNTIGGNKRHGVLLTGAESITILGNTIGRTDASKAPGEVGGGNRLDGVSLQSRSLSNAVGSATAGNTIAHNGGSGISIIAAASTSLTANKILGNTVTGNGLYGVAVTSSSLQQIGGAAAGEGNTVTEHKATGRTPGAGIAILSGSKGTVVRGNTVGGAGAANTAGILVQASSGALVSHNAISHSNTAGIDINAARGSATAPNRFESNVLTANAGDGVLVRGGSQYAAIHGNSILQSGRDGVRIQDSSTSFVTVTANRVGVDADGNDKGNKGSGIFILTSNGNTIGGKAADGLGNTIRFNDEHGVVIDSSRASAYTRTNLVQGNTISSNDAWGVKLAGAVKQVVGQFKVSGPAADDGYGNVIGESGKPNASGGVLLTANAAGAGATGNLVSDNSILSNGGTAGVRVEHVKSLGNVIGRVAVGTVFGRGNVIADNAGDGVLIDQATRNQVFANSIFGNAAGIALANGGNAGQPAPVLSEATLSGSRLTLRGTIGSAAGQKFVIECFDNDSDASPQARRPIGSVTVTTGAGGSFLVELSSVSGLVDGDLITASVTSTVGNTSTISSPRPVTVPS